MVWEIELVEMAKGDGAAINPVILIGVSPWIKQCTPANLRQGVGVLLSRKGKPLNLFGQAVKFSDGPRNPGFIEKVRVGRYGERSQNAGDRYRNHDFDKREAAGGAPCVRRRWSGCLICALTGFVCTAVHSPILYAF